MMPMLVVWRVYCMPSSMIKVSLKAANDNLYKATEWFNVPLGEIEKAINLVIAGDIKDYRMDGAAGKVVLK